MAKANQPPLLLLGDIEIELVEAPKGFDYSEKATYSEHPTIEGQPGLQWLGENLKEIRLDFRFGAGWCDPDKQLRRLQRARKRHQPMALVMGTGRFQGSYVLEEIRTTVISTDQQGNLDFIEVQATLKETLESPSAERPRARSPFRRRRR